MYVEAIEGYWSMPRNDNLYRALNDVRTVEGWGGRCGSSHPNTGLQSVLIELLVSTVDGSFEVYIYEGEGREKARSDFSWSVVTGVRRIRNPNLPF
jgi:hypothetical protein